MNRIAPIAWTAVLLTSFLIIRPGCAHAAGPSSSVGYWPNRGWRTTTPEQQGMDSGTLADMVQTILDRELNVHSITIVRNGYVVMDSTFFPLPGNAKHNLRSCSKSVVSILVGIAIDKGYIKDVNQAVLSYFPDKTIAIRHQEKEKITLENLLTMTTGLKCVDGYRYKNKGLYEMWQSSYWA